MKAATARAHPNIALVKYWGKRDETLMLPAAGSLSMTLDAYPTTTEVTPASGSDDEFVFDGELVDPHHPSAQKVTQFLDVVRQLADRQLAGEPGAHKPLPRARVSSHNEAPTAAGLASSAAGFAALAVAAAAAYGLDADTAQLSRLARRGSGSACRSVIDRFAIWHRGEDDASSFAEATPAPEMRMVVCAINAAPKAVSSREGMRLTQRTSPFYDAWAHSTEALLRQAVAACRAGDFTRLGELTEVHAFRMHALTQSSEPPLRYLAPASWAAFDRVAELRAAGIETYATADAGPNVVAIARPADAAAVAEALSEFGETRVVAPGAGAQLLPGKLD